MSDELGFVAEEVSKQSGEGTTWFLSSANTKMQE